MRNLLSQIFIKTSQVNPLLYIIIYSFTIFIFAYLYTLPNFIFYHSTIQYEKIIQTNKEDICNSIIGAIKDRFFAEHNSFKKSFDAWEINANLLGFTSCLLREDSVEMEIPVVSGNPSTNLQKTEDVKLSIGFLNISFRIRETFGEKTDDFFAYPEIKYKSLYEFNPASRPNYKFLFPSETYDGSPKIRLTKKIRQAILDQVVAEKGFPNKIPNHFFRMLYLSLITITTTGYGDILPINIEARLLTGSEAFIGIVIAGLFVSSVFQNRKSHGLNRLLHSKRALSRRHFKTGLRLTSSVTFPRNIIQNKENQH